MFVFALHVFVSFATASILSWPFLCLNLLPLTPTAFFHPGLLWLALVWMYYSPHACGGARLSCIVASRLAQNWHFSFAQKTYGEALVCTRLGSLILNAPEHWDLTLHSWWWLNLLFAVLNSSILMLYSANALCYMCFQLMFCCFWEVICVIFILAICFVHLNVTVP